MSTSFCASIQRATRFETLAGAAWSGGLFPTTLLDKRAREARSLPVQLCCRCGNYSIRRPEPGERAPRASTYLSF